MSFIKDDDKKLEPSLIPWVSLFETAAVFTHGSYKYGKLNFEKCSDTDRYINAMERHILSFRAGEETDEDSGLHHLAHVAACAMILMHLTIAPDIAEAKERALRAIELGVEAKKQRSDIVEEIEQDIFTCPGCGGFADNGFSREIPPAPYYCTRCETRRNSPQIETRHMCSHCGHLIGEELYSATDTYFHCPKCHI